MNQRAFFTRVRLALALVLLSAPAWAAGASTSAMSLDDILTLLSIGSKTEEILPELTKRGFSGTPDADTLRKIKQAGGDVPLLLAVKKAAVGAGTATPPQSAPTVPQPSSQASTPAAAAAGTVVPLDANGYLPKTCDQWDELGSSHMGYIKFRKGDPKSKSWGLVAVDGKIALKAERTDRELLLWSRYDSTGPDLHVLYWDNSAKRWLLRAMERKVDDKWKWTGTPFEDAPPQPLDEKINWLGDPRSDAYLAWYQEKGTKKYGFVSSQGAIVIPARWDEVLDFGPSSSEPTFPNAVADTEDEEDGGSKKNTAPKTKTKWQMLREAFGTEYSQHAKVAAHRRKKMADSAPKPPVALVRSGDRWGAIDPTGREIIPPAYDKASLVSQSAYSPPCIKVSLSGKYGLHDGRGVQIVPPLYDRIEFAAEESPILILEKEAPPGSAPLKKPRERSYGERLAMEGHNLLYHIYDTYTGALVKKDMADYRFLFINDDTFLWGADGKNYLFQGELVEVPWADMRSSGYSSRLTAVALETKEGVRWGFAWPDGTVAIPPRWKHVSDFSYWGFAYVSNDDQEMPILDKRGGSYPSDGPNALADSVSDPAAAERDTGHYGLIDVRGNLLFDMNMTIICQLSDHDNPTEVKMNGRWGRLDHEGKFTPDP